MFEESVMGSRIASKVLFAMENAAPLTVMALAGAAVIGWRYLKLRARVQELRVQEEMLQELVKDNDPRCGETLGGYLLLESLGAEDESTRYRAVRRDEPESVFVVEVLWPGASGDESYVSRLQRETQVWKSLEHPGLLRLLEFHSSPEVYWTRECCDGRRLDDLLKDGFPRAQALDVLDRSLSVLEFLHGKGICYQELRPDFLWIEPNGNVRLEAFPKPYRDRYIECSSDMLGKPEYMSPERICSSAPSPESDQYGVGVLAYRLFTGRGPFEGEELMQTVASILQGKFPSPRERNPEISADLEKVILKMMATDPKDRYPSLTEAARALRSASF
jgi:eukaryotic-like serine/threonine-protein kinase